MRRIQLAGFLLVHLALFASACGAGDSARPTPATSTALSDAPAAAPASTPAPPAARSNPDTDAVEAARPSLRACYEKARAASAALGRTTVTLSLRVDEAGHVSTVDLEYKHKLDEASKSCMRDAAFAIKLPVGQPRRVTVPVTFDAR